MTKQELVQRMQDGQAWVPGKRVKLDFGDQGVILLDGAASQVSEEDGAADTTIKVRGTTGRRWPPVSSTG